MESHLDFVKKYTLNSDIYSESEQNIKLPVYSIDSLSMEFFNENLSRVNVDLIDNHKENKVYFREFVINNEKVYEDEKIRDEKIEDEKVEKDNLLTRLIKSLLNYRNFTN